MLLFFLRLLNHRGCQRRVYHLLLPTPLPLPQLLLPNLQQEPLPPLLPPQLERLSRLLLLLQYLNRCLDLLQHLQVVRKQCQNPRRFLNDLLYRRDPRSLSVHLSLRDRIQLFLLGQNSLLALLFPNGLGSRQCMNSIRRRHRILLRLLAPQMDPRSSSVYKNLVTILRRLHRHARPAPLDREMMCWRRFHEAGRQPRPNSMASGWI